MTSKNVIHLMNEKRKFLPNKKISNEAYFKNEADYKEQYKFSLENPDKFWMEQAHLLTWDKFPSVSSRYKWETKNRIIEHTWFEDGALNVSFNCLDRHVKNGKGSKVAFIWQGDDPKETKTITYVELLNQVCQFANVLKSKGIQKGDRVCIYMPMVIELPVMLLACARIGAIHSVVFGGFSAESLTHRINDSQCKALLTANQTVRGGKVIPLKKIVNEALIHCPSIENVIVYKRTDDHCEMHKERDFWYDEEMSKVDAECHPVALNAEDPLFILYTSGSTGKPKGVVHTQAGYLLYVSLTHKYIFDIHDNDIYWCTADIGWVTGHSYIVYGPLCNHSTIVLFEGIPTYPHPGRFWEIIDHFKVTVFYTAPTALRSLISFGEEHPKKYNLNSLRVLGTVGEPINPEAWIWYYQHIGKEKLPIVDTWWQTETGGIMISPFPGCHELKPGSAKQPFFGVDPVVFGDDGKPCKTNDGGSLCIKRPWPGIMRTTWGDHNRFIDTYFTTFDDVYFSGDGCRIDEDGDYWLMGRIDDVVNVSGHRIGTAEVESALVSHESVAEAAVVPIHHEIKGQGLYAFVTTKNNWKTSNELKKELLNHVKLQIGSIAVPEYIQFAKILPKTRSGKIMRRILRKIANRDLDNLGDVSTLSDPSVIDDLLSDH